MDVEQNYVTVTLCVVAKSHVLSTAQPEIYVQGFKFTDYGDGSPPMGPRFFSAEGHSLCTTSNLTSSGLCENIIAGNSELRTPSGAVVN